MNEDIGGSSEKLPPEKLDPNSRLGFMDLEMFCATNKFAYYIAYSPACGGELSCQSNLGGSAWGKYGTEFQKKRIKFFYKEGNGNKSGASEWRPTGVAGQCMASKKKLALNKNAATPPKDASEEEKIAAELAKECGIVSSWAISRDGAVFEFGTDYAMNALPQELIDTIGGSMGVETALNAVRAIIKMGAAAKKSAAA